MHVSESGLSHNGVSPFGFGTIEPVGLLRMVVKLNFPISMLLKLKKREISPLWIVEGFVGHSFEECTEIFEVVIKYYSV